MRNIMFRKANSSFNQNYYWQIVAYSLKSINSLESIETMEVHETIENPLEAIGNSKKAFGKTELLISNGETKTERQTAESDRPLY